jgi:ATP-dependent RNA helicase DeaD
MKRRVDEVVMHLEARGYPALGLHGDMTQQQRNHAMDKFKRNASEILVATDVAARGIDVENIEAVFNYDIPQDEEYYVHRIGRTARAGKNGLAFTFVVGKELYKLRDIESYASIKIPRKAIPTLVDVEEVKTTTLLDKVRAIIDKGNTERYVQLVESLLKEDYATLDIAAALLKMAMDEEPGGKEYPQLKEFQEDYRQKEDRFHDRRKHKQKTSRTFTGKKRY